MRAKAGEAGSTIADVAQQAGSQAKQAASSLASDATQKAKCLLNMQVTAGADLVGHVAESARRAADSLDQNAPQLAELVREAAERTEDFSRELHDQTVEGLVRTASDFTRGRPVLVFGLASLAKLLAFRVFKSTPPANAADVAPIVASQSGLLGSLGEAPAKPLAKRLIVAQPGAALTALMHPR